MTNHGLNLERPYTEGDPLAMEDAREASRRASRMRRDAEAEYRELVDKAAQAEADYRQALAKEIVTAKLEHPATVAVKIAEGECRKEFIDYKVAEGMLRAQDQRLRSLEGERSMLKSLIEYSATIANVLRQTSGTS